MIKISFIPPSTKRVELHTKQSVNEKIDNKTVNNIKRYKNAPKEELTERLHQLNREWDTERVLETNASIIVLISSILALTLSIYWVILIIVVSFFLLVHAVIGWCPPLPLIRRMGYRTPEEISDEKTVIKYMRGDFSIMDIDPIEFFRMMKKD